MAGNATKAQSGAKTSRKAARTSRKAATTTAKKTVEQVTAELGAYAAQWAVLDEQAKKIAAQKAAIVASAEAVAVDNAAELGFDDKKMLSFGAVKLGFTTTTKVATGEKYNSEDFGIKFAKYIKIVPSVSDLKTLQKDKVHAAMLKALDVTLVETQTFGIKNKA